ncbi:MAG TPA: hypothetical protein PLV58_12660 [Campylobacterales bacterium]|nr:hypothetical protein [Campylobacterales bacterium]
MKKLSFSLILLGVVSFADNCTQIVINNGSNNTTQQIMECRSKELKLSYEKQKTDQVRQIKGHG